MSSGQAFITTDANNTLAQRNGTAQQESRIYGTYSGAGDYRRLALKMSTAGVAQIVAEGAGTGASGNRLEFVTGGATRMTVAADGGVTMANGARLGSGGGGTAGNYVPVNSGSLVLGGHLNQPIQLIGNNTILDFWFNGNYYARLQGNSENALVLASGLKLGWAASNVSTSPVGLVNLGFIRSSADVVEINNGTAGTLRDLSLRNLTASGTVQTGGYTFANLPSPATQGMRAYITDGADIPLYMANAAGGGSTVTPVFYNGTNWINA
jgi:hypothetical protein